MRTRIDASLLRPGMRFTSDVFIEGDNLFVPADSPIEERDIDMLKCTGTRYVWSSGLAMPPEASPEPEERQEAVKLTIVRRKALETAGEENEDEDDGEGAASARSARQAWQNKNRLSEKEVFDKFTALAGSLDALFYEIAQGRRLKLHAFDDVLTSLLALIVENPPHSISFILGVNLSGFPLAKAAVDTTIISVLLAREIGLDEARLPEVALCALLHDIGMFKLPAALLSRPGPLNEAERELIHTHALHSYRMICEMGYAESVARSALHHHENWNGTGYPHNLATSQIEAGAQLVAVADTFIALIQDKPYRKALLAYDAVKTLVAENSRRFCAQIIRAFIQVMGIYPVGSYVLLSDKRTAQVVAFEPDSPRRPSVRVFAGRDGSRLPSTRTINLLSEKSLYITGACPPEGAS